MYKDRINIKRNPLCKTIWINENLDSDQRKQRAIMRTIVDFAKDKGKEARLVGDIMIISGLKYEFDRLDHLPEQIELDKVFTHLEDDFVLFQSEYSWCSSFARVDFEYKGRKYTTAEQAFCYEKAVGNDQPDIAEEVLKTTDPRKCKSLVATIKTSPEWNNQEKAEMAGIVTAKFQNPAFRNKLLDTGERHCRVYTT